MMNRYFFIPGRNYSLSKAELISVLKVFARSKYQLDSGMNGVLFVDIDQDPRVMSEIFHRLGGFIKFGEIIDQDLDLLSLKGANSSAIFGVSSYSSGKERRSSQIQKDFIKSIKKGYKDVGVRARYVGRGRGNLSAGQIVGSGLLEKGFELVLFEDNKGSFQIGRTLGVQDIEGFSARDYDKPYTDTKMGVLPPKLARIMVNLAQIEDGGTLWDPFCGSGGVLLEGILLGYNVVGSDIDKRAIYNSKENMTWLSKNFDIGDVGFNIFHHDIRKLDKKVQRDLQNTPLDAIIFEPFMGPPQRSPISKRYALELLENVKSLYKGVTDTAEHIKKERMTIVSVVPSYKTTDGWIGVRFNELFSKRWEIQGIGDNKGGLHWDRSNSIIRRNLLIAKLKY